MRFNWIDRLFIGLARKHGSDDYPNHPGRPGGGSLPRGSGVTIDSLTPKAKKKAYELIKAIVKGNANLVQKGPGSLAAHTYGTRDYKRHVQDELKNHSFPSYFTVSNPSDLKGDIVQKLIDKDVTFTRNKDGSVLARVELSKQVGIWFEKDGKEHETSAVCVRYSPEKNDWHYYPCA